MSHSTTIWLCTSSRMRSLCIVKWYLNARVHDGGGVFVMTVLHTQDGCLRTPSSGRRVIHCFRCGEPCRGQVLRVQANHFHVKCFTCKGQSTGSSPDPIKQGHIIGTKLTFSLKIAYFQHISRAIYLCWFPPNQVIPYTMGRCENLPAFLTFTRSAGRNQIFSTGHYVR